MSVLMKSCTASLLLAVSLAASAAEAPTAPVADDAASTIADAQIAVRDAKTGQLRSATPAEMRALTAAGGQAALMAQAKTGLGTKAKHHKSGATGIRVTDQFMSASVIVKQADGSLVEYCFQSPEAAQAAVSAPAKASTLPTE